MGILQTFEKPIRGACRAQAGSGGYIGVIVVHTRFTNV